MRHEEIRPDPELRSLLRRAEEPVPLEEVEWSALRRSIGARAELPLARRRAHAPARRTRRWAWSLVPLATAASVALAMWLGELGGGAGAGEGRQLASGGAAAEEVFSAELSEQEFRSLVSGRANADALLLIAASGN